MPALRQASAEGGAVCVSAMLPLVAEGEAHVEWDDNPRGTVGGVSAVQARRRAAPLFAG